MSLNPSAPIFTPVNQTPVVYVNSRRVRRRRRNVNRNINNNSSKATKKVKAEVAKVVQVSDKLEKQVAKLVNTQRANNPVPQLGGVASGLTAPLLITPEKNNDLRLNSSVDSLRYMYNHLLKVLKSGAGSIGVVGREVQIEVSFPSNQLGNYVMQLGNVSSA